MGDHTRFHTRLRSSVSRQDRHAVLVFGRMLLAILLVGGLLRVCLALYAHAAGDGCWHLGAVRFIAEQGRLPGSEFIGREEAFWPPPFYQIIASFFYRIGQWFRPDNGLGDAAAKLVSPLFGTASLFVTFLIGKRLFGCRTALASTLFTALIPIHLYVSTLPFPDATAFFLGILAVYYALRKKVVGSGVLLGLAMVTKTNAALFSPLLIFITYHNLRNVRYRGKIFAKQAAMICILALAVMSPMMVRNFMLFNNPVYPYLNQVFNAPQSTQDLFTDHEPYKPVNIAKKLFGGLYLSAFGIPEGHFHKFSFLSSPYLRFLIAGWFILTALVALPIFLGLYTLKGKQGRTLLWWIIPASVFALMLYFIPTRGAVSIGFDTRYLLPALPAASFIWGAGFIRLVGIMQRKMLSRQFIVIAVIILLAVSSGVIVKTAVAKSMWDFYSDDFSWVQSNTGEKSLIYTPASECMYYNLQRPLRFISESNIDQAFVGSSYFFVSQDFRPDNLRLSDDLYNKIMDNAILVYYNNRTGTRIYLSIRQENIKPED
ncbi:hypothetical protein COT48_04120 [Candidatus Woesearchaeota archaeon CG08_land_8_20_14_0_20_47_9]|nr:MAG: hypothetical protein COT48_04120 [Candidatus Woesearchaeota archaeon CG08_land_8_20_14_0_20_47_9]